MRDVHTIRLRGPWQVQVGTSEPRKVVFPATWGAVPDGCSAAEICLTRYFHSPTGLEDLEQVWLVVEFATTPSSIRLNETPLGQPTADTFRHEITGKLINRNQVEVLFSPLTTITTDQVILEARLEIGFP